MFTAADLCRSNYCCFAEKNKNTQPLLYKIPPAGLEKQFSFTVVCLVNVLSFAKEAAYMCVTAEEEELALR